MNRLCSRPSCSDPAEVAFNFDGLRRIVWLNAITNAPGSTAGDLCKQHAARLRPPVHWELRDLRTGKVTVIEPPPERPVPLDATTAKTAKKPRRDRSLLPDADDASAPEADESTPMLARAFRAAG